MELGCHVREFRSIQARGPRLMRSWFWSGGVRIDGGGDGQGQRARLPAAEVVRVGPFGPSLLRVAENTPKSGKDSFHDWFKRQQEDIGLAPSSIRLTMISWHALMRQRLSGTNTGQSHLAQTRASEPNTTSATPYRRWYWQQRGATWSMPAACWST